MPNRWKAQFLTSVPVSGTAPEYSFRLPGGRSQWEWVEFVAPSGARWYGSFEQGAMERWRGITPVFGSADQFVILAGGAAYWLSAATHSLAHVVDAHRINSVVASVAAPKVVAAEDCFVLVLSEAGTESKVQVAVDHARLTAASGAEVIGVAEDWQDGESQFAIDVNSHGWRWL
jgi:hypothetical protein